MRNTRRDRVDNTLNTWDNTDAVRITTRLSDAFLQAAASVANAQPLGEVVSEVVGGRMASKLSKNQRAAHAWFSANGDLERMHTCGVYLRDSRVRGSLPVLGVYVDTSSRVTDFRANKDLYLSRLANRGFEVSDIDFRLSRTPRKTMSKSDRAGLSRDHSMGGGTLPELSGSERERVEALTRELPAGLRQTVQRAMLASLRREKKHKT